MDLDTVLRDLNVLEYKALFAPHWNEAQAHTPTQQIQGLMPDYVKSACEKALLDSDTTEALARVAKQVAEDRALRSLWWHFHYRLYRGQADSAEIHMWPMLTHALGTDAGFFNALLLLSGTDHMQAVHRARNIPHEVFRDTVLDLDLCARTEDFYMEHGVFGIDPHILDWLMLHWRGQLYRLGRLQFVVQPFPGTVRAFRKRETDDVVALAGEGIRFRSDGQFDGTGGVHDEDGAWDAVLKITGSHTMGNPIHPLGYAVRKEVALSSEEWMPVLSPSDPVLGVHIPTGSPLDFDECGESLQRALEFFPKYFPDRPFVGFCCTSWFLDSQLERLLPANSNVVRFQKEMYLYPVPGPGTETLRIVFGSKEPDLATLPNETTMQRALARHLHKGGHFRDAGGFILTEDLDWSKQVYRSRPPRLWQTA